MYQASYSLLGIIQPLNSRLAYFYKCVYQPNQTVYFTDEIQDTYNSVGRLLVDDMLIPVDHCHCFLEVLFCIRGLHVVHTLASHIS